MYRGFTTTSICKFRYPILLIQFIADLVLNNIKRVLRFLVHAGIDSVKTDAQFFLDVLANADERRMLTKAYQDAWYINSLRFFSNNVISCMPLLQDSFHIPMLNIQLGMSLVPQIIFHSQLPINRPRIMVRNSDGGFPIFHFTLLYEFDLISIVCI